MEREFRMQFYIEKAERLSDTDIHSYIRLIRAVWQDMPEKNWFAMDEEAVVTERLLNNAAWLYTAKETGTDSLAGIFMVTFPALGEDNLGYDLGFTDAALLQTAHMDTVVILPAYRGRRLQQKLMQAAERDLKQAGYKQLLCTIHPDNRFSLQNAVAQGYRIAKSTVKYGNLPRCILCKTI